MNPQHGNHCPRQLSSKLIDMSHVSSRETAIYYRDEGDAVRAAALQLLRPVNQVLCALLVITETIRCSSE